MQAALTGATGFIGSHVLADLSTHGHEVTTLVRDDTQADTVAARAVTPAVASLHDRPTVSKLLGKCGRGHPQGSPGDATSANLDAVVVDAVTGAFAGVGRPYLQISGLWIYGANPAARSGHRRSPGPGPNSADIRPTRHFPMSSATAATAAKENDMTLDNEQVVRQAYQIAENKDLKGWVAAFNDDGTFADHSIGVTYRGPDEPPVQVQNHARAFQDMHRELYRMYLEARATAADTFRRLYWDTALSWGDPVLRLLRDAVGISPELTDSERTAVLGVTATKLIPPLASLRPQTQPHAS
jgi:NAD(P)H-binding